MAIIASAVITTMAGAYHLHDLSTVFTDTSVSGFNYNSNSIARYKFHALKGLPKKVATQILPKNNLELNYKVTYCVKHNILLLPF